MSIVKKYDALCEFSRNNFPNCIIELFGEKVSVKSSIPIPELFFNGAASIGFRISSISPDKTITFLKEIREDEL